MQYRSRIKYSNTEVMPAYLGFSMPAEVQIVGLTGY